MSQAARLMERRGWYLSALGVVSYVPRGSVSLRPDEPPLEFGATPPARAPTDAARSARQAILEDPSATVDAPSRDQKESVTAGILAPQPKIPPEQGVFKARLAVWAPTPDLLLVDSLSPDLQPTAAMARLVANITAAMGAVTDGVEPPQLLDWPPMRGPDRGLDAARAMVSAFCDARLAGDHVRLILVMGSDAASLMLPEDTAAGPANRAFRWRGVDTVVIDSLSELLDDVDRKRRAWHVLLPFVRS